MGSCRCHPVASWRRAGSLVLLDQLLDRRDLSLVATLAHRAAKELRLPWTEIAGPAIGVLWSDLPHWILSVSTELPDTHVEVGAGASFEFRRNESAFDRVALE